MEADVIEALWARLGPAVYITREQFAAGLQAWQIEVMRDANGRIALIALVQGSEFHLESFGGNIPITPAMIRQRFEPIMQQYGCVTTRMPREGSDRQHRFNKAFGFKVTGGDEFFICYRLEPPCL